MAMLRASPVQPGTGAGGMSSLQTQCVLSLLLKSNDLDLVALPAELQEQVNRIKRLTQRLEEISGLVQEVCREQAWMGESRLRELFQQLARLCSCAQLEEMARGTLAVYFFGDQRWIGCYLGLAQTPLHHSGDVGGEQAVASPVGVWALRYLAAEILCWRCDGCAERCRSSLARFHECDWEAPFKGYAGCDVGMQGSCPTVAEEVSEEALHALMLSQIPEPEQGDDDPLGAFLDAGDEKEGCVGEEWRKRVASEAGGKADREEWRGMGKQMAYCTIQPLFVPSLGGDATQELREAFRANVMRARAKLGWFFTEDACTGLRFPPPNPELVNSL